MIVEVSGQRASKEEWREDNRVEEDPSVVIRVNWSVDGNEERTVEERASPLDVTSYFILWHVTARELLLLWQFANEDVL